MEDKTEFVQQSSLPQQPNIKPQTPPEQKPHSFLTSRLFPITLVILIGFTFGYVGIYLSLNSRLNQMAKPNPTPQTPPVSLTQVPDETANWNTYANTKFGFIFKYPIEWPQAKEEDILSNSGPLYQQISFGGLLIVHARDERHNSPYILEEIITSKTIVPTNAMMKDVGTENFKAFKIVESNGNVTIHISESLKSIEIIRFSYNQNSLQDTYVDQILSTFKFLDQTQVVPTTNPEGKFCGGFAANLPENQCPLGYKCQLDGKYPDAGGKCVKQ